MVAQIRCPYCGHPDVPATAASCLICGGDLGEVSSASAADDVTPLGSLSHDVQNVDIDALLNPESNTTRGQDEVLPIDRQVEHVELELEVAYDVTESIATAATHEQAVVTIPSSETRSQKPRSGGWAFIVYALFVFVGLGALFVLYPSPRSVEPAPINIQTKDERLGLEALQQERYGAAIDYLERVAHQPGQSRLLPSLALAYSRTGQLERSREIMRVYRSTMVDNQGRE